MCIAGGVPEFSGRVRRSYARAADRYESRWSAYLRDSLGSTIGALHAEAGERILDVGCGTGRLAGELAAAQPGLELWGVDLSAEMIEAGVRGRSAPPEGRFAVADAAGLPFANATFDAVVSSSSLHHWARPADALREIARVTREGGRLVLTDWSRDVGIFRPLASWLRFFDRTVWHLYSRAVAAALVRAAGYRVEGVTVFRAARYWGLMTITAVKERTVPQGGAPPMRRVP